MLSESDRKERFDRLFKPAIATLAVMAFCIQPALAIINPDTLMVGGAFLSWGILACYADFARWSTGWRTVPGLILGAIGVMCLAHATTEAGRNSRANDVRCEEIERDMFSKDPVQTNGPEIFTALRCRPQTLLSIPATPKKPSNAVVKD